MRSLFPALFAGILLSCTTTPPAEEETIPAEPPNIAWFVSEDNSQYLGVYGNQYVKTPTLDSMARVSVMYRNAYSNAPVCAPSRSGIITGVYPVSMGTQEMRTNVAIPERIGYYIDYLKEQGYYLTLRAKRDYNIAGREGDSFGPINSGGGEVPEDNWDKDNMWNMPDALEGRSEGQPFHMFYNTFQTHESRIHGPDAGKNYFLQTFNYLGEDVADSLWNTIDPVDPDAIEVPDYLPDLPEVRSDLALYYTMMEAMDLEFKMFLKYMRENGLLENTIIIYTSDHGGVMARSKRFAMETGLKIPMFIWYPEKYRHLAPSEPGTVSDELVSLIDIAPTILDMAGTEIPDYMSGSSLLTPYTSEDDLVFGFRGRMDETTDMVRTIRQGNLRYSQVYYPHRPDGQNIRYLWNASHLGAWQEAWESGRTTDTTSAFFETRAAEGLYDVENDPYQLNNLAGEPAYEDQLEKMRNKQLDYLKEIGDLGFIPEGILFERYRDDSVLYMHQYDKESLDAIIESAVSMTLSPSPDKVNSLVEQPEPAYRFWAAMGALNLARKGTDMSAPLNELASDDNGDVRATAAEGLYYAGREDEARRILFDLLDSDNPYVLVRVMGTIDHLGLDVTEARDRLQSLKEWERQRYADDYVQWLAGKLLGE